LTGIGIFQPKSRNGKNHNISEKFKLIITPLAGNIEPNNWDIVGGPKSANNKSKMAAAAIFENTQKGISRPVVDRSAPNLVCL